MTTLAEQAATYAAEQADSLCCVQSLQVLLTRAYMAGALEGARHPPQQVLRECLDFARAIGTPAERATT